MIVAYDDIDIPTSMKEAFFDPKGTEWKNVMEEKIIFMIKNYVWEIVNLSKRKSLLGINGFSISNKYQLIYKEIQDMPSC